MTTCQCKCKFCGVMFTARVADRKRGWARFCSKSCKAKRQHHQNHPKRRYYAPADDNDAALHDATDGWDDHKGWMP